MRNEIETYQQQLSAAAVGRGVQTEMMVSRQAQEVQAAIVIAKRFPRDTVIAYNRVMEACKRKKLAENAVYEYPRGGEKVTGPSIRLAEVLAQNWGNIDFGITELEQKNGESQVMAYAWDLETNTRQTKIFTVPHIRHTKKGDYQLTDPRDIYELVANQGARRMRACILGVIPGDVVDAAIAQCDKTLSGSTKEPLVDRIRKMTQTFKDDYGVTKEMLEKYIGWKTESFTDKDLVKLGRVYISIRDGMAQKEEIFDMNASADDGQPIDAFEAKQQRQAAKTSKKKEDAQPQPQPTPESTPEPVPQSQEDELNSDFAEFERQFEDDVQEQLSIR